MDLDTYLAALARDGSAMADAADRAGLDAVVPSCPGWVVRDLVRHTGGIHRWATGYVGGPRTERWDVDLDEVVGSWPEDEDLIPWFRTGVDTLRDTLASAPADLECWTFLRAPSPRAMWSRRQAHETAIHRVDAELAAGSTVEFAPDFAGDGIDELLAYFITRRGRGPRWDEPRVLRVTAEDGPGDWLVSVGPERVVTTSGDGPSDCQVAGPASALYLTLWNRREVGDLSVVGDRAVLGRFLDEVHIRWS